MVYDENIINEVRNLLLNGHETIAVAESVTSGHLQAALSLAVDASQFFQGGLTAYNLGQKTRHLNIEPIGAMHVNCVNEKICRDMALNAQNLFLSDYAIGITGYASMVPECEDEGLHAFIGICHRGNIVFSGRLVSEKASPFEVQVDYANQALSLLLKHAKSRK